MAAVALGVEPVDKELIPEGRALLNYFESIYGQKTLTGGNGTKGVESIRRTYLHEQLNTLDELPKWKIAQ